MKMFKKIIEKISWYLALAGGMASALQMFMTCGDVFARNVLKSSLAGTYELTETWFVPMIIFLGMPLAYISGIMPKVEGLYNKLPGRLRKVQEAVICVLEVVLYILLTYAGFRFMMKGIAEHTGVLVRTTTIPTYPIYFIVPLSFLLMAVCSVAEHYKAFIPGGREKGKAVSSETEKKAETQL